MASNFVYTCVLVSGVYMNLSLLCTCFPGTPALQANRKLSKSVTYELHKPRAYIYMTHHHAYFLHWHYLCRVVSCILQFLCYAMQLFSSRFPMNRERKCCNQSLWMCWSSNLVSLNGVSLWPAHSKQHICSRICLHTAMASSRPAIKVKRYESKNLCKWLLPNDKSLDF